MSEISKDDLTQLAATYPLSINTFLEIAIALLKELAPLQHKGQIHHNLFPENIFYFPEKNRVQYFNFKQDDSSLSYPTEVSYQEAALPYLAPEQTGRINQQADIRSNLYSLGCIYYEMLTGRQVFEESEASDLIYAHIAKTPQLPLQFNTDIPPVLNEILLKLLSKNVTDRYQTIEGLLHDLEKLNLLLSQQEVLPNFRIGQKDLSQQLAFPDQLYGREQETKLLQDSLDCVKNGLFALFMIGGYSGIGKTSLVLEIQKTSLSENILFIQGKYDLLNKNLAYSALLQALQQAVQRKLSSPPEVIQTFSENLLQALDGQGQLIIDVLPDVALLIGKQRKLPILPVAEAQNRFLDVLCRFVTSFASAAQPLVMFIDDLQWADLATIKFLQKLADFAHHQYVLFIGAYRDNEVSRLHPLMLLLSELKEIGHPLKQVLLKPLQEQAINSFLADTLHSAPKETKRLASTLNKLTGANPFFLKLLMQRLVEDGLLSFNNQNSRWEWDLEEIQQASITDNVAELLTQKLKRLSSDCQQLLQIAASLGNKFDIALLEQITNRSHSDILQNIFIAQSQQIILPIRSSPNTGQYNTSTSSSTLFQFAHDRAQQASYQLANQKERQKTHLLIADQLLGNAPKSSLEASLFDIVNHFNIALPLIDDPEKLLSVRALNLQTGKKAMEATAFSNAYQFYKNAIALFTIDDWENLHQATAQAYLEAAECAYICGDYEAADTYYALLFDQTKQPNFIAKAYDIQLRQYAQQGRNKETLQRGAKILKQYGVRFFAEPSLASLVPRLLSTKLMLLGKNASEFINLPTIRSEKKAYALNTLMNISATAYVYNANTMLLLVLRMVQLSVKYGNAPESAFGYGLYGFVEGAALGNAAESKKYADLSIQLSQSSEDPILRAKVKFLRAFSTQHWFEPIPQALPKLLEAFKMLDQSGSYTFAGYSLQALMAKRLYLGEPLKKYLPDLLEFARYADLKKEYYTQNLLLVLRAYVATLSGQFSEQLSEHDLFQQEEAYLKMLTEKRLLMPVAWHYVYNQMLYYHLEDYEKATHYAKKAKIVDDAAPTTMAQIEHHFYNVLLSVEQIKGARYAQQLFLRGKVRRELRKLQKWTKDCPANFQLRSEIAKTVWSSTIHKGDFDTAYENLFRLADAGSNLQLKALSLELWGKYLFKRERVSLALDKINQAIKIYQNWGAAEKAKQLLQKYFQFTTSSTASEKPLSTLDHVIDADTILKATQAISTNIVLEKLLSNLLIILMENAGAQRGFLILKREDLRIETAHSIDQSEPIVLQSEPVSDSQQVASSIVHYVWRTGNYVLLDDALTLHDFSSDVYFQKNSIRSLLSLPIKYQGTINAIVYLENNSTHNVFTEDRLQLVTTIATQAAVSIENALLYNSLEQKVEERTMELVAEQQKTDELLLNILPKEIANELKEKGEAATKVYEKATILFADFQNFTMMAEYLPPKELVELIDRYFTKFDEIMQRHGIEKIKTVGDAYIAAGGLPDTSKGTPHEVIQAAIDMQVFAIKLAEEYLIHATPCFEVRIGIHTGSVIAGVVGKLKFAYDIWGDTVNIAARLEQNGEVRKINISGSTYEAIKDKYPCTYRGKVKAKNKGEIDMYFVEF